VERTTTPASGVDGVEMIATLTGANKPDQLICIKSYRPPVSGFVLEFPSGLIDAGETAEKAATRELIEETGFTGTVDSIAPNIVHTDSWKSTENCHLALMSVDRSTSENKSPKQDLEDTELIQVVLFPKKNFLKHVQTFAAEHKLILDAKLYMYALGLQSASA
jgi:8-oxo-dGTP pyrophosphatase MutT (NUDIX family)